MGQVRGDQGLWLPEVVSSDEPPAGPGADRESVYAGIGGMAPVLAEIGQYRADRLLNGARTTADGLAEHAVGHQAGAYWRFTEQCLLRPR